MPDETPGANPAENQGGFTLLEMLVAITLLAVMVVILSGGFGLSIRAWESGEKRIENHYDTVEAMAMITRQIKNLKSVNAIDDDTQKRYPAFSGNSNSMVFVTALPRLHGPDEEADLFVQSIAYDPLKKGILFEEGNFDPREPLATSEGYSLEMGNGKIESIVFEYYAFVPSFNEESEGYQWVSTVSNIPDGLEEIQNGFPKAVRIRMVIENETDGFEWPEILVPIGADTEIKVKEET